MIKRLKGLLSALLALCMLLGLCVPVASAELAEEEQPPEEQYFTHVPTYENTYVNTGNQRLDILGVALTQMGYCEGKENHTLYGSWYGFPGQPWCATFISWCARQAQISEEIVSDQASVGMIKYEMGYQSGTVYTPQPGDLFMTRNFGHVGLVYRVEGEFFYTIEGNSNDNGSDEGYTVITNQRVIKDYYFAIPEYLGEGEDHQWVYGQEEAHPHKRYYECSHCGERFYTDTRGVVSECTSCAPGFKREKAGWYISVPPGNQFATMMRPAASYEYDPDGGIHKGDAVYVYGVQNGWGYVEYHNRRGYVNMNYLEKYYPAPAQPALTADKDDYVMGENVSLQWEAVENNDNFRLRVWQDDTLVRDLDLGLETACVLEQLPAGQYTIRLNAYNKTGYSSAAQLQLTVRNVFSVTYDAGEGIAVPQPQEKILGQDMTISADVPVREGFDFLGWTTEQGGTTAYYQSGGLFSLDEDCTLYGVWKNADAVAQSLQIHTMPRKLMFVVGDELDTAGLSLMVHYSDGTAKLVREGYTTDGFHSDEAGAVTVTITYEGVSATYEAQVMDYLPGDINGDNQVTEDDAIFLLRSVLFPERYVVYIPADYTEDNQMTEDDAIYLLRHVLFSEKYPLK